jgi:4-hydroxy-3-methylbut-2-enyl diphosphate reductase
MEVSTAKLGWCMGIERAYRLMNRQAATTAGQPIYATHRPPPSTNADLDTLSRIAQKDRRLLEQYPALQTVQVLPNPSAVQDHTTLMLGYHGLSHDTIQDMASRGVEVKDYQCPFIAKLDDTIDRMVAEGFDILIMGKRQNHHCLHAQEVASTHQRQCVVIETLEDLETMALGAAAQWALVGQVTGNTLLWDAVVKWLQGRGIAARVMETICSDSYQRQEQAMALAHQAACCLVVDDGGGATVSLLEVLSAIHERVYRVRWQDDGSWKACIDPTWLTGADSVAVVGGILVPQWALQEVAAYVQDLA